MSVGHSLGAMLAQNNKKLTVPENILSQCSLEDKVVVENILLVMAELIPNANVAATVLSKTKGKYKLSTPLAVPLSLTLSQMRALQTYNPARLTEVSLKIEERPTDSQSHACFVVLEVADQSTPITVQEIEVMRMSKRSRWF